MSECLLKLLIHFILLLPEFSLNCSAFFRLFDLLGQSQSLGLLTASIVDILRKESVE